jgi:hypothetical protein
MLTFFKKFSLKNFAKKLAKTKLPKLCKKLDRNIGFWEKRQFFRRKLAKIAENCDHNIDPGIPNTTSYTNTCKCLPGPRIKYVQGSIPDVNRPKMWVVKHSRNTEAIMASSLKGYELNQQNYKITTHPVNLLK